MFDARDTLFDLPDNAYNVLVANEPTGVPRCASTPETRARWAEIKKHKLGSVWQEGEYTYRRGPKRGDGLAVLVLTAVLTIRL